MTPDRWKRISTLLDALLALPPGERHSYLITHCRDDVTLQDEVWSLMQAHEEATGFLEEPVASYAASLVSNESPAALLVGREIRGYRILSLLGEGGAGHVYKAEHLRMGRLTALKFLHPYLRNDERSVLRFIAEAQAASALDHPNICRIYTIDETRDERLFIAMPYYEGETIKQKIARGPLPLQEALDYAVQMAHGLGQAHAQQIIHRDIKPANVMITRDGGATILDFGLAKMADVHLTQTGRIMGTPAYMSPEQIKGERVYPQTDVWSLGVVLYEMLTGKQPFHGARKYELIDAVIQRTAAPVRNLRPDLPEAVEAVVERCLQKNIRHRYADAAEVFTALATI